MCKNYLIGYALIHPRMEFYYAALDWLKLRIRELEDGSELDVQFVQEGRKTASALDTTVRHMRDSYGRVLV